MIKENNYEETKATMKNAPIGTTVKVDSMDRIVTSYSYHDEVIDLMMNDIEGEIYITSKGVGELMGIEHKHMLRDYIKPLINDTWEFDDVKDLKSLEIRKIEGDNLERIVSLSKSQEANNLVDGVGSSKSQEANNLVVTPGATRIETNIDFKRLQMEEFEYKSKFLKENIKEMFIKSTYKDKRGKTQPQYLISSKGFMFILGQLPNGLKKGVNSLRAFIQMKIIDRFDHYRLLLSINFQDYIKDVRAYGKLSRKLLTKSIKDMLETHGNPNNMGNVYKHITTEVYRFLQIPIQLQKDGRDEMNDETLNLIQMCETILASWIITLKMKDNKFDIMFLRKNHYELDGQLKQHLNMDLVIELSCKDYK